MLVSSICYAHRRIASCNFDHHHFTLQHEGMHFAPRVMCPIDMEVKPASAAQELLDLRHIAVPIVPAG